MRILIVEDERLLADSIRTMLKARGYDADTAYDGEEGLVYARRDIYDLIILDIMMPKLNGFQVAKEIRSAKKTVPILMLTARSELNDRIDGLNSGADYYLTKPFDSRELLACIHALLRRQNEQSNTLTIGSTSLDLSSAELKCGDHHIRLSAREFEVMRLLMQSGRKNLSKETLLNRVWGYDSDVAENSVEAYVGFLRKKLKSIGSGLTIEAVRRIGYHLEEEAE